MRAVAAEEWFADLHFPRAGIDVSCPFGRQPNRTGGEGAYARTTPAAVNVRGFERLLDRNRGGSRCGLARYIDRQVVANTRFIVQHLAAFTGTGFTPPEATVQASNQGRVVTGVAVCQGNVYTFNPGDTGYTVATNATGATPPLNYSGLMYSAANNQKLYFVDGVNYRYYDPVTNTVYNWTATAGELPYDSDNNYARLICTWRGRTVLGGLLKDPHVLFMSRISDPHDWEYGVDPPDPARAASFTAESSLGLIGDVVNCLIPFSDDVLIIGCDSHIYMHRGDPNDGGKLDLVTKAIGMAWGQPWCQDETGTIYFFSNRPGVYAMVPGQQPVRISNAIDPLLQDINTGTHGITMAYDTRFREVRIFVTLLTEPAEATHYCYDVRNGAWYQDEFANEDHNPLCTCVLDGNRPDDRVVLLGSWDGRIRAVDPAATKDDLNPIASQVTIGPLLTKDLDELLLKDLQAVLGEDSEDVSFAVYVGTTAEGALASTAVASGTWRAGRNPVSFVRRSGHAVYVTLSSSKRWALESIRGRLTSLGKVRRRGF